MTFVVCASFEQIKQTTGRSKCAMVVLFSLAFQDHSQTKIFEAVQQSASVGERTWGGVLCFEFKREISL